MKLTVDLNDPADVQAALAVLQGHGEAPAAAPPAAAPPAAAPPAAAPPAAAPPAMPPGTVAMPGMGGAPAASTAAPVAPAPSAAAQTSPEGYTMVQVTQAIQAYAKQHKTAAAKAVLAQLGVEKASDLDPSQYGQALQMFAV